MTILHNERRCNDSGTYTIHLLEIILETMRGRISILSILMKISPGKEINMMTSSLGLTIRPRPPRRMPRNTARTVNTRRRLCLTHPNTCNKWTLSIVVLLRVVKQYVYLSMYVSLSLALGLAQSPLCLPAFPPSRFDSPDSFRYSAFFNQLVTSMCPRGQPLFTPYT